MSTDPDRLYELVPVVYRLRDAEQGYPLRALLQVITEQADVIERDIAGLYENWFIETCDEWVVPYIGALIGYSQLSGPVNGGVGTRPPAVLSARREVANTVRFRRRKGTASLVEELARAVSGWPVRAVEFYRSLGVTQNLNFRHVDRGRTAELRDGDALDDLDGPFDEMAHAVDVRRGASHRFPGHGNIPELGIYVWRLKSYTVARTLAHCHEEVSPSCYLFSPLGNDTPLYTNPDAAPPSAAVDLRLPVPIRRRRFAARERDETSGKLSSGVPFYYGDGKSLMIWTGAPLAPYPASQVVPADLSDWSYRPLPNQVAVDPQLGRLKFAPGQARKQAVSVSYSYGFSTEMGGGEYERPLRAPPGAAVYQVGNLPGSTARFRRIGDALTQWKTDHPENAVIEITDSSVYTEPISISLDGGQTLYLRAANGVRPILRMLDWETSFPDSLSIAGAARSWFVLDGIVATGRGLQVDGDVSGVAIRHSTLVPGWGLECNCDPKRPSEPSIELLNAPLCLTIEHSIVGAIQVERDETRKDPVQIRISDSIVDATSRDRVALGASGKLCAFADLVIVRSTVIGRLETHAIALAENSILLGQVRACRRQQGCIRFCYVAPGSRTPRRYECQPDLVEQAVADLFADNQIDAEQRDELLARERSRADPEFNSLRYGNPTYCQLADACAVEISAGAEDESEMGAFHDLYQPQRVAALRTRLAEYTPAGCDTGVIIAS
jgi:hypothetical protein